LDPTIWNEDDYDYMIVDETTVGRLYTQRIHGAASRREAIARSSN